MTLEWPPPALTFHAWQDMSKGLNLAAPTADVSSFFYLFHLLGHLSQGVSHHPPNWSHCGSGVIPDPFPLQVL